MAVHRADSVRLAGPTEASDRLRRLDELPARQRDLISALVTASRVAAERAAAATKPAGRRASG